jgi:PPM family protein phosphatase
MLKTRRSSGSAQAQQLINNEARKAARLRLRAGRCAARSVINQRARNEDSWLTWQFKVPPKGVTVQLLAVADGMGGHAYGEHASREVLRRLSLVLFDSLVIEPSLNGTAYAKPLDTAALGEHLHNAIAQANAYLLRMIAQNGWHKAGTTLVAALIHRAQAVIVNLGDSPLYHCRGGRVTKVSEDHSVAGQLLSAGLISATMARHHAGRHQLAHYLGQEQLPPQLPVRQLTLERDDLLLLCSDGVSGSLSEAQLAELLRADGTLARKAEALLRTAKQAGETDNQTLILWQC